MSRNTAFFLAGIVLVGQTGCAPGPDFVRPGVPKVSVYAPELPTKTVAAQVAGGESQHFVSDADVPGEWWELFGSPELNTLVERSLKANPSLDAARAALSSAQETVAAQRGAFWPQVSAGVALTRQRIPDVLSSPLNVAANPFSLHTAQLNVSYAPDLFGGNRRQVESLVAQADYQRFAFEGARLTLAANVAVMSIQETALRSQIAASETIADILREMLELSRRQQALGAAAEANTAALELVSAQAQAALPPLRKQWAQVRDQIKALAGDFPDAPNVGALELGRWKLPQNLPISLPSKLVEQRPDVRAAEAQMHAAAAQVGVAISNILPQVSLTGGLGFEGTRLGDLFGPSNALWTVAAALAQPIFQGGTLTHRKAAAEASLAQAEGLYRATVIAAFQNVADTLHALDQDAEALRVAAIGEHAASRSLAIARQQFELGDISHFGLLNAEQTYQQALVSLTMAQANRYQDTVALFLAMGGGWWHSSEK